MKTIVVFVKAPVPGRVKTRLIPALGANGAARLYHAMAQNTLAVAGRVPRTQVLVAYAGKKPPWRLPWFRQRGKNLGERLIHAFDRSFRKNDGPVLTIGSDLPSLTPERLEQAFSALKKAPVVIGPSPDGGYYLIGLRSPQPQLFRKISWSSPKVCRQTLGAVRKSKLSCRLLPPEQDIDTIQNMRSFFGKC